MAVGNISGPLLTANLLRNGKDLAFETDLLFLNVSDPDPQNFKIGISTSSPAYLLDINGTTRSTNIKSTEVDIGNVNIKLNTIKSSIGNLTLQAATNTDNIIISSKVESQYLVTLSGEIAVNTATNNQSYTTTGTGVITIASGTTGSINNITIGNTTPSTGNFTVVTVGASANTTRFPNAKLIISDTATSIQQNEIGNIGIIAEAVGAGATRNAGVYGVGYTAGAFTGQGVVGESHVSAADDTAPAVGVRGYANDIRTVGNNVGLYGDASSGIANYSLYLNSGDIYTAGAKTWYLTGNLTFNGAYSITIPTLALTNALPVTSGGTGVTTSTGTTNVVLSNSPTLVTPTIGDATATTINKVTITQPSASATLTIANAKILTVNNSVAFTGTDNSTLTFGTGGTVAYTKNKLNAFASTTSAELAGNITDETGTGSLVFANTPTLVTPVLGDATATTINKLSVTQPSTSATLTIINNKTLTVNNTVAFTGTDNSTLTFGTGGTVAYTENKLNAFASTTSAELAGNITDETGTGSLVFANTPTLVTPTIGDATATTINKLTITAPTTSATLTLVTGSTLITSGAHSLTLTTTADTTVTFPTTGLLINSNETTLSSLSSVGTITTGTWSGLFGAVTGANLTNLTSANLTGTIPATVLGNSSFYIGTIQIALNRATGNLTLAGVNFGTTDVTTSFTIPIGTTVSRPSTPATGNIRYNTDTTNYEGFDGTNWSKMGSGLTPTPVKTSSYTALEAQLVRCDSAGGSFLVMLPASPFDGATVGVIDVTRSFSLHPVTIIPSANTTIESDGTSLIIDLNNACVTFVYVASTNNWKLQETPNMLSDYTLQIASTVLPGAVRVDGTTIVINNQGVISATGGSGSSTLISVIGAAPILSSGGTTPTLSISKATASTDGYVSSTDWNVFNSKLSTVPTATAYAIGGIKVGYGLSINGAGELNVDATVVVPTASATVIGGIRVGSGLSIDMNGILNTTNFVQSVSGTAPISVTTGVTPAVSISQSNSTTHGYLSSTDWTTFNNKLGAVPMASANILGGIKVGSGLAIDTYGTLSATTAYSLPIATSMDIGGVKVDGTSITINGSGTISTNGALVMYAISTTNAAVVFTTNNNTPDATNQLVISADYAIYASGIIIGKEVSSANTIVCSISSIICNNAGTITNNTTITEISNTVTASVPTVSIDAVNGALAINSGYKSSTTISWTVKLNLTAVS